MSAFAGLFVDVGIYSRKTCKADKKNHFNATLCSSSLSFPERNCLRILNSISFFLSGLYPPCDSTPHWHGYLNWTPVTVHSTFQINDTLMAFWANCDLLQAYLDDIYASSTELHDLANDNDELISYITQVILRVGIRNRDFRPFHYPLRVFAMTQQLLSLTTYPLRWRD